MLKAEIKIITEDIELHVIDLKVLTDDIIKLLDAQIVGICEGDSDSTVAQVKSNFLRFLSTKDERTVLGATAEFFVHLYLNENGFKQEFLFFNLEEGSIKKGFDGYFSKESKEYIVESKSGSSSTKNISHKSKIREAYNDVKSNVEGKSSKSTNNPWRNAYNHASHIDVQCIKPIRQKIKKLSDLYNSGKYIKVEEFNIIPCSTIFLDGIWVDDYSMKILNVEIEFLKEIKAKTAKIICLTKNSNLQFMEYLRLPS
jgi:hypothetical protein